MGERPDELRQSIAETRDHLGVVANAISQRLDQAVDSTRQRVSPRRIVGRNPGQSLSVAFLFGYLVGMAVLGRP